MKMGSFIVGSLVGMAGAIYLSNRSPSTVSAMSSMFSSMKNNKMMSSMAKSNAEQPLSASSEKNKNNKQENTPASKHESKQMLQNIIENDPKLKEQFNEIKNEASSIRH